MSKLIRNGWEIYFYKLFSLQRNELKQEVSRLREKLSNEEYIQHPTVKRLAAIMRGIKEEIVQDPYANRFTLTGNLRHYGRLKKLGLDDRYRLFFRAMEVQERKIIFILWLGFPRKDGDKNDCYHVFTQKVMHQNFPKTLEDLLDASE